MKKLIFLMSFFLMIGMTVQAQSDKKACCSKTAKASCSKEKASASVKAEMIEKEMSLAEIAASENENIQVKKCAKSGAVSFFEKGTDDAGEVTWTEVAYDEDSKTFTRVAAASMEKEVVEMEGKAGCSKADKASCSKKGEKSGCSKADKKSCSKDRASCSKSKVKSASAEKEVVEMDGKKACCSKEAKASCSKKGEKSGCSKADKKSCSKDKASCSKSKVKSASAEKEVIEVDGKKKACCSKDGAKKSCSKKKE